MVGAAGARIVLAAGLLATRAAAAWTPLPDGPAGPIGRDGPIDDGRDHYTLFYRHPVNRQLQAQLQAPDQGFRSGLTSGRWAFASDLALGTEQTGSTDSSQGRFHGYYLVDTYLSAHILDGLEANLNLLLFNPSASDGYRVSSQLSSGFALHGWVELLRIRDRPLRLDVFGTDLGWVTVGAGLLLEQIPLEGATARLSLGGTSLTYTFAGRTLWQDDDVSRTQLSALNGRVGLVWLEWRLTGPTSLRSMTETNAQFISAYADLPLPAGFHLAAEFAVRPRRAAETGALARADYLGRPRSWLELHAGYQFRWYERRFGPRDRVELPSVPFNTPHQEDVYVTNSFEYLGHSSLYDQWSHTAMFETRVHAGAHVQLFAQGELWARFATSPDDVISFTPEGFSAPGRRTEIFYRAGATALVWKDRPHRVNVYMTNKQVSAGIRSTEPVFVRFQPGTYVLVELQAFL